MRDKDIPSVSKLWNQLAFDQMSRYIHFNGDSQLLFNVNPEEYFNRCYCDPKCCVFVVEYDNQIIGFLELWLREKDFWLNIENHVYVTHLFINKEIKISINPLYIPSSLFKACENQAVEFGCNYVCADVFNFNKEMQILLELYDIFPVRFRYLKRLKNDKSNI